jgi:hypothetical protein
MASPISVAELVRIKDRPENEWYLVDRIFPDTHRAKVHVVGSQPIGEIAPVRIVALDNLISDECRTCELH